MPLATDYLLADRLNYSGPLSKHNKARLLALLISLIFTRTYRKCPGDVVGATQLCVQLAKRLRMSTCCRFPSSVSCPLQQDRLNILPYIVLQVHIDEWKVEVQESENPQDLLKQQEDAQAAPNTARCFLTIPQSAILLSMLFQLCPVDVLERLSHCVQVSLLAADWVLHQRL